MDEKVITEATDNNGFTFPDLPASFAAWTIAFGSGDFGSASEWDWTDYQSLLDSNPLLSPTADSLRPKTPETGTYPNRWTEGSTQ